MTKKEKVLKNYWDNKNPNSFVFKGLEPTECLLIYTLLHKTNRKSAKMASATLIDYINDTDIFTAYEASSKTKLSYKYQVLPKLNILQRFGIVNKVDGFYIKTPVKVKNFINYLKTNRIEGFEKLEK